MTERSQKPDVIDAEFEVVEEARPWNGIGLPPDWPTWAAWQKVGYLVLFWSIIGFVAVAAHCVAYAIGLPGR